MTNYKIPVELTAPDGTVFMTEKNVEAAGEKKMKPNKRDSEKIKEIFSNKKIDVVVVVKDDPASAVKCIKAINERTTGWIDFRLIVVDNVSGEFTHEVLVKMFADGEFEEMFTMQEFGGRIPAMNAVLEATADDAGDWIVFVDQRTIVTEGWLEKMLGAVVSKSKVSMVVPWTTKRMPPAPGRSYRDASEAVEACSTLSRHEIALPGGFCTLVERKMLDRVGGFDMRYVPGYGEFAELYMRLKTEYERKAVRADDCLVLDESLGASESRSWMQNKSVGFIRFRRRWSSKADRFFDLYSPRDKVDELAAAAMTIDPKKPAVVFLFHEAPVCGLVLAATHICNALIERGWSASFACTKIEKSHWRHIPARFSPFIFRSESELKKSLPQQIGKNSVVVATTWPTASFAREIVEANQKIAAAYYVQDDERRFRYPSGALYSDKKDVERSYSQVENLVANSEWVANELKRLGHDPHRIGIGVDTLVFHPEEKHGDRFRIMAHSRPSTPRRGWEFVRDVFNRLGSDERFEFVTYDEKPEGLNLAWHGHLGRISPRELAMHMSRTNVFFEGSEMQGWGMQALEAMSCGCALVCSNNQGIDSFGTSGHDCVVVPHGDVDTAAAVVKRLIDKPKEVREISKNARKTAEEFDWSIVAEEWDRYLRGILK